MTITVKLADGTIVTGEKIAATKKPAAKTLQYKRNEHTPTVAKGKQRQIVLDILHAAKDFLSPEDIAKQATVKGLSAVGGILPSVQYHLHQINLAGHAETK